MTAKPMNGSYYEFIGRYLDTYEFVEESKMSRKEAKREAINTESDLYMVTYKDGILQSVDLIVGSLTDYPRSVGYEYFEPLPDDLRLAYNILSRLKMDCEYVINYKIKMPHNFFWAGNPKAQIEEMKLRWDAFGENEKPEWLSMDDIKNYERQLQVLEGDAYESKAPKNE